MQKFQEKMLFWLRCSVPLLLLSLPTLSNSLIDPGTYQSLTSDTRSLQVGRPIVILVVESTNAQSVAGTGISNSINFEANSFDNTRNNGIGVGASGQNEGNGKTVRNGTATTRLSAMITETLPNGVLRISGEQNLLINDENQKILISGLVRIEDITKDNTLLSSRIANAQIEIQGKGVINNAQSQGIITKVMAWLGLL